MPFKERESPEDSPAVPTMPLLVFPESNRPFVNSAISQSARSISSDSHSICSSHFPEGRVGAVPAPSLRLPLPHARSFRQFGPPPWSPGPWSPGSLSSASLYPCPLAPPPPWPRLAASITISPSGTKLTCLSRWAPALFLRGLQAKRLFLHWWPSQGP